MPALGTSHVGRAKVASCGGRGLEKRYLCCLWSPGTPLPDEKRTLRNSFLKQTTFRENKNKNEDFFKVPQFNYKKKKTK